MPTSLSWASAVTLAAEGIKSVTTARPVAEATDQPAPISTLPRGQLTVTCLDAALSAADAAEATSSPDSDADAGSPRTTSTAPAAIISTPSATRHRRDRSRNLSIIAPPSIEQHHLGAESMIGGGR